MSVAGELNPPRVICRRVSADISFGGIDFARYDDYATVINWVRASNTSATDSQSELIATTLCRGLVDANHSPRRLLYYI